MLSISFLDLAHNAINSIGFLKGNLWVSYKLQCSSNSYASFLWHNFSFWYDNLILHLWKVSFLQVSYFLLLLPILFQNQHLPRFQIVKRYEWYIRLPDKYFLNLLAYDWILLWWFNIIQVVDSFPLTWAQKTRDEGGKDIMKKHRRQVLFSGIVTAVGMTIIWTWLILLLDSD